MKALCLSEIKSPKHGFNLFVMTLDKILGSTIQNDIGRSFIIV